MGSSARPILQLQGLEVGYSGLSLFPALNCSIHQGEFWGLVGRNGAGKSTLLRALLGFLKPIQGHIQGAEELSISFVAQRQEGEAQIPARVYDYVAAGHDRGNSFFKPRFGIKEKVYQALAEVDAVQLVQAPFSQLSEGQRQRVRVAQALVSSPQLLVMDEPTSAMDVVAEKELFGLLANLVKKQSLTVLLATHRLRMVENYCSHAFFVDREHSLAFNGKTEELKDHQNYIEVMG